MKNFRKTPVHLWADVQACFVSFWFCLLSGQLELSIIFPLLQSTFETPFNLRQHCIGEKAIKNDLTECTFVI